jgi:hypothetical protein
MSFTAKEVQSAIETYDSRFWDTGHPNYDEELEDDGVQNVWDYFIYDENNRKPVSVPGLGNVEYVDNGTELGQFSDKNTFVIVKVGDQFFKMEGWYDSWGGESGWEGPFYEVKQVEKTVTVWEKQNDN